MLKDKLTDNISKIKKEINNGYLKFFRDEPIYKSSSISNQLNKNYNSGGGVVAPINKNNFGGNIIDYKKEELIKKLFSVEKRNSIENDGTLKIMSSTVHKLKSFVSSIIKKDDTFKKKIEEFMRLDHQNHNQEIENPMANFEADGFKINVESTGEKLVDFSKPFYISSGEPETVLKDINYKDYYNSFNLVKKVSSYSDHEFDELDTQITKKLLMGQGFDELLEDKKISGILLGGKKI